ncbi:outer membrane protein assembly factor BamE [Arcticibacter sp. MXS-1]|uniref:outer membrane protein assembly factor BamE domain-containing protein n=1 Tax=Arcticibacter sp. MXS-1 TaxID=3341726 RepID=UPI0035A97D82
MSTIPNFIKPIRHTFLLLGALFAGCSNSPKKLSTVETGMTRDEVIGIVGEPKSKNVLNATEVWDYPDADRTVVFRKDTVYQIITSPQARADSIAMWMDKTDDKVKDQLSELVDKAGEAGNKISEKLKKDSTK